MKRVPMIAALVALAGMTAWGQVATTTPASAPAARKSPIALAIWAQALEKPDLHYQLTPRYEETSPGNAAVKYMEAAKDIVHKDNEYITIDTLRYCPLKDLDEKAAAAFLQQYQQAFHFMREGARLDSLNWESNIRRDGAGALLPGLGSMRQLATVLSIAIRVDIKNHRWAEAQDKLQTGFAMARQMGHGETIIECLVGAVIQGAMNNCLEEWVSEPGSPNMYWPLTNLGDVVNCQRAVLFERSIVFVNFPEMKALGDGRATAEAWVRFMTRFFDVSGAIRGDNGAFGEPVVTTQTRLSAALYAAAEYPRAKDFLVARGMKREAVEKMAVADVVGRYFVRSYEETADDLFKTFGLPLTQSIAETSKADTAFSKQPRSQMNILARILLPSLARIQLVSARGDRQVAMLRTVESLRAYAAEKGQLPEKLDQLTLPLPLNPYTGAGFAYERNAEGASVIGSAPDGLTTTGQDVYRYDLKLKK